MSMQNITEAILQDRIIAIVRGVTSDRIVETVRALLRGGIRLIELTLSQDSEQSVLESCRMIEMVKAQIGEKVLLGAGTVTTPEQVDLAVKAGAEYIISPNVDLEVIRRTKAYGKISIPGALTPTEAAAAHRAGADFVKLFPAGLFGAAYLKAVRAPLSNVPFLVVGNISKENIRSFLDAGAAGAGIGGELVDKRAVAAGAYEQITQVAKLYISRIKE